MDYEYDQIIEYPQQNIKKDSDLKLQYNLLYSIEVVDNYNQIVYHRYFLVISYHDYL